MRLSALLLILTNSVFGQIVKENLEKFPAGWKGDTSNYNYFDGQLHLKAPAVTGTSITYLESEIINNATWSISINLDFNPSSNNYVNVILAADTIPFEMGYYVQVGSTADDIKLIYKNGKSKETIIDSPDKILNQSNNYIEIEVTRDLAGTWNMQYRLDSLTEYNLLNGGTHISMSRSKYFAIDCHYTSTRSRKFHFGDLQITGEGYIDTKPPIISLANFVNASCIQFNFNEYILPNSGMINGPEIEAIENKNSIVSVKLVNPVTNGTWLELYLSDWQDSVGNKMLDTTFQLLYFRPMPVGEGDIVINEMMIDPSPPEDLPESEYIEIWNISDHPVQLKDWMIYDLKTTTIIPGKLLLPDSLLLLVPVDNLDAFPIENKLGLSPWPSLNNSSDSISLVNPDSLLIDFVAYKSNEFDSLYSDGLSIELVNPRSPCGKVWRTSSLKISGSPGKINSRYNSIGDTTKLEVISVNQDINGNIYIGFNKTINSSYLETATFKLYGESVEPVLTSSNNILIESPKISGIHTLTILDLQDCWGNTLKNSTITWESDFSAPKLDSVKFSYFDEIRLFFNEPVVITKDKESFYIPGIGKPSKIFQTSEQQLNIRFDTILISSNQLILNGIEDTSGNSMDSITVEISGNPPEMANSYELIVSEFLVITDPNGEQSEFIEIYNPTESERPIRGYLLEDARSASILSEFTLAPKEYVVLIPDSKRELFNLPDEKIMALSHWPVLNDSEDVITIKNPNGDIIHRVNYNREWVDKSSDFPGFTFEMIDLNNPCSGLSNWNVSKIYGGSPGAQNTISAVKPDLTGPKILDAWLMNSDSVALIFDERLDSLSVQTSDFTFTPAIGVSGVHVGNNEGFVLLILENPLVKNQEYTLKIDNVRDCNHNMINQQSVNIIRPDKAVSGDVVINEILFNPSVGGVDFLEIYNLSEKYLKIQDFALGNKTDTVAIINDQLLHPHQFMVFTPSKEKLLAMYPNAPMDKLIQVAVPSWPDDEGLVTLIGDSIIDQFGYSESMHHDLLFDKEGVSLERYSPYNPTSNSDNWKSASSISGYSTPGKINSNYMDLETKNYQINVDPKVFIPGGITNPFTTIHYQFENPDYLGTVTIFNTKGQLIKSLLNLGSLGSNGFLSWDGVNEMGKRVATGYYLIMFEILDPNGETTVIKEKVVVGTHF